MKRRNVRARIEDEKEAEEIDECNDDVKSEEDDDKVDGRHRLNHIRKGRKVADLDVLMMATSFKI